MQSASGHIMHLFLSIFAIYSKKQGLAMAIWRIKIIAKISGQKIYTKNVRDNIPIQILKPIREEIENE